MTFEFSRRLALVAGVALPVLTTIRRWPELRDPAMWLPWLDDWALAGFLVYGAWRAGANPITERPMLAAAWGFACGLGYASFAFALLTMNAPDSSTVSAGTTATVKGVLVLLAVAGLAGALRSPRLQAHEDRRSEPGVL